MLDPIIDAITAHAARDYPNEACGLIVNSHGNTYVKPCENLSHTPDRAFLIDPLIITQHDGHITAVYHSHPNAPATPSVADIAASERCMIPYLILSYPGGELQKYTPQNQLPAPYERRPFVYGVLDCLSLVTDYYQHELGIKLIDNDRKAWEWWLDDDNAAAFVEGFKAQGFYQVNSLQKNDVIIMQLQSRCPNHAAIYAGENVMLHHPSQNNLSRYELYGDYWRKNTVCFLRHKNHA